MIRIAIIILAISLAACSNRHPAYSEYDIAAPMIVKPADSVLIGEYELDEFSYARVDNTKAYDNTPIRLTMVSNGVVQFMNLPDMVIGVTGKPIKKQLLTATGSWSMNDDAPKSSGFEGYIDFWFKQGDTTVTLINQLCIRDNHPAISIPFGPRDAHQRLLFVKKDQ